MIDSTTSTSIAERKRGYSLGSLMIVVSYIAVLLSGTRAITTAKGVPFAQLLVAIGIGSLACGLLGMFVGVFHFRRVKGALVGILGGTIAGGMAVPLVALPDRSFGIVAATYGLGSAFLVGACWLLCTFSKAT